MRMPELSIESRSITYVAHEIPSSNTRGSSSARGA